MFICAGREIAVEGGADRADERPAERRHRDPRAVPLDDAVGGEPVDRGALGREAGRRIAASVPRADIGDHLGLTTETVSRTFTQFKSIGCIALRPGSRVEITDRAGLEEIAEGHPHGECAAA
jgi:hypothetical protein